jgi:hypothetical protein
MPRVPTNASERLGPDALSLLLDAARRERSRRGQRRRKAGAAGGGALAAFLAAAGIEAAARDDLSALEPSEDGSVDQYRLVDAGEILSFAEICANGDSASRFGHALHELGSLASASFEAGFEERLASRLASRFASDHDDQGGEMHAADPKNAAHASANPLFAHDDHAAAADADHAFAASGPHADAHGEAASWNSPFVAFGADGHADHGEVNAGEIASGVADLAAKLDAGAAPHAADLNEALAEILAEANAASSTPDAAALMHSAHAMLLDVAVDSVVASLPEV